VAREISALGAAGAATGQEALAATSAARFAPAAAREQHAGGQQQHSTATGSAAGRRTLEQRQCSSRPGKQGVVVGASRACSGATGWVCVRVCVAAALPGLAGRVCTILNGVCVSHVECVPENGDGGLQLTVVFQACPHLGTQYYTCLLRQVLCFWLALAGLLGLPSSVGVESTVFAVKVSTM
jgi:hypothetical protein